MCLSVNLKFGKIVLQLPDEQHNPASSKSLSPFSPAQREQSTGFNSAALQPQSRPIAHIYSVCRIRLMAPFTLHVAPEHTAADSLAPISRFPAWLLIEKVIPNEELRQRYG